MFNSLGGGGDILGKGDAQLHSDTKVSAAIGLQYAKMAEYCAEFKPILPRTLMNRTEARTLNWTLFHLIRGVRGSRIGFNSTGIWETKATALLSDSPST